MSELIRLNEAAKELFNVPYNTLKTWKARGKLPSNMFKTIGKTVFIKKKVYEKWLDGEA